MELNDFKILKMPMAFEQFNDLWISRSISYPDAEILYSIITTVYPKDILEFGTFIGLSAKIMAIGVRENGFGEITSVDLWEVGQKLAGPSSPRMGHLLDEDDLNIVDLVTADEVEYLKNLPDNSVDLVFEDTNHSTQLIEKVIPELKRVVRPEGIILFHNVSWKSVQEGFKRTGITEKVHHFAEMNGSNIGLFINEDSHE